MSSDVTLEHPKQGYLDIAGLKLFGEWIYQYPLRVLEGSSPLKIGKTVVLSKKMWVRRNQGWKENKVKNSWKKVGLKNF